MAWFLASNGRKSEPGQGGGRVRDPIHMNLGFPQEKPAQRTEGKTYTITALTLGREEKKEK